MTNINYQHRSCCLFNSFIFDLLFYSSFFTPKRLFLFFYLLSFSRKQGQLFLILLYHDQRILLFICKRFFLSRTSFSACTNSRRFAFIISAFYKIGKLSQPARTALLTWCNKQAVSLISCGAIDSIVTWKPGCRPVITEGPSVIMVTHFASGTLWSCNILTTAICNVSTVPFSSSMVSRGQAINRPYLWLI